MGLKVILQLHVVPQLSNGVRHLLLVCPLSTAIYALLQENLSSRFATKLNPALLVTK